MTGLQPTLNDAVLGPDGQPYRRGRRRLQSAPPAVSTAPAVDFEPFEFTALRLSAPAKELAGHLSELTTTWTVRRDFNGWNVPGKVTGEHAYPTEVKAVEDTAARMTFGLVADQLALGVIRITGDGADRFWLVEYGEPRTVLPQPVVNMTEAEAGDGYTLAILGEDGTPFARAVCGNEAHDLLQAGAKLQATLIPRRRQDLDFLGAHLTFVLSAA